MQPAGLPDYSWQLFDAAPDAIAVTDAEGRIILVNAQMERLFGYDRNELLSQPIEVLVPEPLRARHRGYRASYVTRPGVRPMGAMLELHCIRKDGTEFPVEINLSSVNTPDGLLVSTSIRDVTELRRTEKRYRGLLDAAPDSMVVVDGDGRIVLVNSQTERLFGYGRAELIGQPVELLVPERYWVRHRQHRSAYDARPQFRPMGSGLELFGQRKDGTEFPVEISLSPQQVEGETLVSGTIRDATARKRAETALRESEANLRSVIEGAFGMFRARPDGSLLRVNQVLVEILGYADEGELLSRNLKSDIYTEGAFDNRAFARPTPQGRREKTEALWRRRDGKVITVELTGRTLVDDSGQPACVEAVVEDVTHSRNIEQRLSQVQKMEAVGRLAGGVAHDFNNLLSVIIGYVEMLREGLEPGSALRDRADQVAVAAERATTLTRQLLTFSRQQANEPQVVSLNDIVRNLDSILDRLIGEDVEVSVVLDPAAGCARVDPGQLEQVIMNLVVNARDAMPRGGKLTLETGTREFDDEYCRRNAEAKPGSYVTLAVSDNGCGMDATTVQHIFEPFFTTKRKGEGTGLGLSTVYGVVKQCGGFINVYSEVGMGTSFIVYLPAAQGTALAAPPKKTRVVVPGGNETVLIVEDEDAIRRLAVNVLEGKGYRVLQAGNPEEAIAAVKEAGAVPDLLVTDVVMPKMSGPELAALLTETHPGIRVLYVSGYTADAIVNHGVLEANTEFLAKPFSPSMLTQKVRDVLDRGKANAGVVIPG
jgi:two-component system, cell cycle sensor histidine kinase and response regulator CckA